MKLQELAEKLELKGVTKVFERDVTGVYISDMVSDVIANAKAGNLLVTVQIHNNVIAAANLVDICGIIVTQGKTADRRRREDGGEGGDHDLLDESEPLAGGDAGCTRRGSARSARAYRARSRQCS